MFGKLETSLYECKHINAEEADQSKDQFESFVDSETKKSAEEFSKYEMVNDRLDKFFGRWFFRNEKYTSLWKVVIFVFTLSHVQAQIERVFNINADLLVDNLTSPSIVAQRRVYDHLSVTKSSPHGFEIKDELRVCCLNTSSKYNENLREIKNAEKSKNEEEKIDALLSNIVETKRQKIDLQRTITQLEVDAIACYKKGETSNNETIRAEVTKGNSMCQAIGKKRRMISNLDEEISNLKKEVATLKKKARK